MTPANNYADNNYIHHTGIYYKQGAGIWLTGVGNRASHNLIHDGPRFGVYFLGQNLVVEYNHIRNVLLETDDGGVIYTYQVDWLGSRGSKVRYNYCHDSLGWGFDSGVRDVPCMGYGIYLDGFTSGVDVIGNIVAHTSGAGLLLNGGSHNWVSNNVIYECNHPAGSPQGGNQQVDLTGYPTNNSYWTS